jgi:hypothetical protein
MDLESAAVKNRALFASAPRTTSPAPRDPDASMGICRLFFAFSDWVRAVMGVFRAHETCDFAQA